MKVFHGFENVGKIKNPVVTIGSYDGVHSGHMEILAHLSAVAHTVKGESVVITFTPHPRMVLENNSTVQLITTMPEKILLLEKAGIDNLIIVNFTREFSMISYHDFIGKYIVGQLHVHTLLVGYNHHFGHNKEGNAANLSELGKELGIEIYEMPKHTVDGNKVSSTVIRTLIHRGKMRDALNYLGHSYFIMAEMDKEGFLHEISEYKLLPKEGEYPVEVKCGDDWIKAIARVHANKEIRVGALGKVLPSGPVLVKFA